jgi:hypothetical protein
MRNITLIDVEPFHVSLPQLLRVPVEPRDGSSIMV